MHGMNQCQLFKEVVENNKELSKLVDEQEAALKEIQNYKFSYDRYRNHGKSREICQKHIPKIEQEMQELHDAKKIPTGEL
jgi:hypothetical protein